jgi:hypothetical protein
MPRSRNRTRLAASLIGLAASAPVLVPATATATAASDFSSALRAGLGFTSNASLSSVDADADALWLISGRGTWRATEAHLWALSVGYTDYFTASANDVLSVAASGSWLPDPRKTLKLTGTLSLQEYPGGAPANTDVSFNSRGMAMGFEDTVPLRFTRSGDSLTYQGGYQLKWYDGVDRTDHTLSVAGFWERPFSGDRTLEAGLELGMVPSSDPDYSRGYLELSAVYEGPLNRQWKILPMLSYRATGFTNRLTTTSTLVTRRRGSRAVSSTEDVKESYGTLHLSAEGVYTLSPSTRLSLTPAVISQSSRSGTQDYSAVELLARVSIAF